MNQPSNPFRSYTHVFGIVCMPVLFTVLCLSFLPLGDVRCVAAVMVWLQLCGALALLAVEVVRRQESRGNEYAATWPDRCYLRFVFICSIGGVMMFFALVAGILSGWLSMQRAPIPVALLLSVLIAMAVAALVWSAGRETFREYDAGLQEAPRSGAREYPGFGSYLLREGLWSAVWPLACIALPAAVWGIGAPVAQPVLLAATVLCVCTAFYAGRFRETLLRGLSLLSALLLLAWTGGLAEYIAGPESKAVRLLILWGPMAVAALLFAAAGWAVRREREQVRAGNRV